MVLNGEPLDEGYLDKLDPALARRADLTIPEVMVPEGCVYVLPDNRSVCLKPAYAEILGPLVERSRLVGQVFFIQHYVSLGGG
ncbi:MAG: hypothetical protein K6U08_04285 [Firmicutes bacterium]|nr:hypothetical protein [Bacillota bacterium]